MKISHMVFLLLVGCSFETFESGDDPEVYQDVDPIYLPPGAPNPHFGQCGIYTKSTGLIVVTECNDHYLDNGDPPWEEEVDSVILYP